MYPWGALQNRPLPPLDTSRTHMASMEDVAKPFSSPQGQRRPGGAKGMQQMSREENGVFRDAAISLASLDAWET